MSGFSFSMKVDSSANVVHMEQRGLATRGDLLELEREYLRLLPNLEPGFVLVNDQRQLLPYPDEAMEVAQRLVELTNQHKASAVIRIVAESLPSMARVSRVLTTAKARYRNIRVKTPEEAAARLRELRAGA
jgi:hypothetical protein